MEEQARCPKIWSIRCGRVERSDDRSSTQTPCNVGTSNAYVPVPDGGASDAILAFDVRTGKLLWSQQLLEDDANLNGCGDTPEEYQKNCPGKQQGPNDDIGAPPILHTLESGRQILIASQESRTTTVLDPDRNGAIIWQGIPSDRGDGDGWKSWPSGRRRASLCAPRF